MNEELRTGGLREREPLGFPEFGLFPGEMRRGWVIPFRSGAGGKVVEPVRILCPFALTVDLGSGPVSCWSVSSGHMNNRVPTCYGTPINGVDPAAWAQEITGAGVIFAHMNISDPDDPVYTIEFAVSIPDSGAEDVYWRIGYIDGSGNVIPENNGSLSLNMSGNVWQKGGPTPDVP